MFARKAVYYVGIFYIVLILCDKGYSLSAVKFIHTLKKDIYEKDLEQNLDAPEINEIEESNIIYNDAIEKSKEKSYSPSITYENWVTINARVRRQISSGSPSLYPSLATQENNRNYGSYNFDANSHKYLPNPSWSANNSSFSTRQNPYNNFNSQNYNGLRPYDSQLNSNHLNLGVTNNRTTFNYSQPIGGPHYPGVPNYPAGSSYPQSTNRQFYQGASNRSSSSYTQQTGGPSYPGMTNYRMTPNYPQTTSRPFNQGASNNRPSSSYPLTNGSFYPGTTNHQWNSSNPQYSGGQLYPGAPNYYRTSTSYPQPSSRPSYPGVINNQTSHSYPRPGAGSFYQRPTNYNRTSLTYPQPTSRPFYPGVVNNQTSHSYPQPGAGSIYQRPTNYNRTSLTYPQPTSRPFYPGVVNNQTRPNYPQPVVGPYPGAPNYNQRTNVSYPQPTSRPVNPGSTNSHSYPNPFYRNNASQPYHNLPYNSPSNPPYNSNYNSGQYNSMGGASPGTQPSNHNNGLYNTWGGSPNSPHKPSNNYTNSYTQSSNNYINSGHISQPIGPNASFNPNPGPEFFYPQPNNVPNYDPRKNLPEQFSYHY